MTKYGENLKSAYALLHGGKLEESKLAFEEIQTLFKQELVPESGDDMLDYNNCLLGLGEIAMKSGKLEDSLKYYLEGNELTKGKEFNILFNLGVVYKNLGNFEKSSEFLNEALKIEPTNPHLQKFLVELEQSLNFVNESKKLEAEEKLEQDKNEVNDYEQINLNSRMDIKTINSGNDNSNNSSNIINNSSNITNKSFEDKINEMIKNISK